jgi:Spy/CpxP family protein refolding chaperone
LIPVGGFGSDEKELDMHPGFMHWWREAQRAQAQGNDCHAGMHRGGPHGGHGEHRRGREEHESYVAMEDGGGSFGVRRPLRFMAHKLELDEKQVNELAAILDELKTERAQAAVDHRRSVGAFADALAGETFDEAGTKKAADLRVKSAERLRDSVVKALAKTHAMLTPDQRKQLSYLLRSGQLTI